jgi:FtsZ-binding cell division protein ZapB
LKAAANSFDKIVIDEYGEDIVEFVHRMMDCGYDIYFICIYLFILFFLKGRWSTKYRWSVERDKYYKKKKRKLKKENIKLKEEISNIKEEASNIKDENSHIEKENIKLKEEISDLKKENSNVKEENSIFKNETQIWKKRFLV